MISTSDMLAALLATLKAGALFEKVMAHSDADLGAALEHLRDHPSSIAVVVPGADTISHELQPGTNLPYFSEVRSAFEVLISGRELDARQTGAPAKIIPLKDSLLVSLMWADLGIADGLLVLPTQCEPLALEFENGKSREAWKLSLEMRQILSN